MTAIFLVAVAIPAFSVEPHAFPVPFIAKEHNEISFTNLPGAGWIKIFTVNGEEVIDLPVAPGETSKDWAVVNSSGKRVASGVYLYLIQGNGENFTGKIVVIR